MSDELRDEREFQTALEVHSPGWLPGVSAKMSYRRLWDKRVKSFVDSVAEQAHSSADEFVDRIAGGDGFADLALQAASRASECGDEEYVDLLANLVASALMDDAKIDEVAFLAARVIKLQPIHIRILDALHPPHGNDMVKALDKLERSIDLDTLAKVMSLNAGIVAVCLDELTNVGFAEGEAYDWSLTVLGRFAVEEIRRVRDELRAHPVSRPVRRDGSRPAGPAREHRGEGSTGREHPHTPSDLEGRKRAREQGGG